MVQTRFTLFPKEWGIYLPYAGKRVELRDGDLEALHRLRDALEHKHGELVQYKWDIKPLNIITTHQLNTLWSNDLIFKFATTFHTISNRPQYISWYIWGDYELPDRNEGKGNIYDGGYPTAPRYISEG